MSPDLREDITDDAALGGRLQLLQPRKGHRFGHDAILLAAATAAHAGEHVVDLGAGVGTGGLALARRVDGVDVTLVEIDPALCALAAENIARNGMTDRVRAVTLDVTAAASFFDGVNLKSGGADRVLMNPPFYDAARTQASPDAARRAAHVAHAGSLAAWIDSAARLLRPDGVLTLIYRADARDEIEAALAGKFVAVEVLPVYPKPDAPAIRIIVEAVRGAPLRSEMPLRNSQAAAKNSAENTRGLFLNGADGRPTVEAEAILRNAVALQIKV
jgi:tRNA1(Val) A37 N6-methylase TrmN6